MEAFPQDLRILALVVRQPRLFRGEPPRVWSDLPPGWWRPVDELHRDLDAMLDDGQADRFRIDQIKEKYAGLRVYWTLGDERTLVLDVMTRTSLKRIDRVPGQPSSLSEQISARVAQAMRDASTLRQTCGAGNAIAGGRAWLATLCPACRLRADQAASDL